ncbi:MULTISPECIES: AMP-dependent synthetase/ligase [Nocardia]|uniref:AMP-dependent synthetase/ligase n=1 Tax=Nocardia TaxID=1817 RepID=UPI000BF03A13|nr:MULTISPECIES: AMP-dependent synthetase/ligase [Nocardia]MBF6183923.1 long-chain fatty acid--CoA ligase [Nocardia farcinica]MBF6270488.1 long-chain fatty acid--CoA ligase [Nocardia farcinica]MBF6292866.1 long-chain fatty acid--CoA ligase [Nocardia farcinica]MBF6309766.1 long-chain fatty acid--CoA ligase [Nocardia farcinica]MBF6379161.1 long-chain fatty acid--CoA ligase [Nocardia farcinica]
MNTVSVAENGFDIADSEGLYSVVAGAAQSHPTRLSLAGADGTQLNCQQVDRRVRALASALLAHGVRAGDRVAVLGRTGLEWALLDCAVLALGAVVVPVYPTSSPAQIAHIVADSGSAHFAAETEADAERLRAAGARQVWTFPLLAEWSLLAEDPALAPMIAAVRADDPAMIVYTSGTTGVSKGCVITHRNMYVSAANTVRRTDPLFDGTTVLALPLAHVFGQTILFACLFGGSRTHLLPAIPDLVPALPTLRPTFLAMIPYGLEKIRKYCRTVLAEPGEEDAAVARGLELLRAGAVPGPVTHPVSEALGGRLRAVISGGASLDESTIGFYAGFGVLVLNCYGLTEAATAVTVNAPHIHRLGTVGRPIPGTEVAVAEDGEVLVRGPHVSPGYWGAAADVVMADAEGWLHTGDLGALDADGYLRITGRKKEILVTSGGKNVAPAPLEDRIRLHPLVSNCMVVGDGRDFVTALVTLDADQLRRHRAADPGLDVEAAVATAIEAANALVSRAESVRAFRIVDGDFTVESGLITSSRKLRRAAIEKAYAADIAALYAPRTVAR